MRSRVRRRGSIRPRSTRRRCRSAACASGSSRGSSVCRGSGGSTAIPPGGRSSCARARCSPTTGSSRTSSAMSGRCSITRSACLCPIFSTATPETRTSAKRVTLPWRSPDRGLSPTRLSRMAQAPALPNGFELPLEPRLPRIGSVDAVALEERAASLAKRSIKKQAKVFALELAIRCMDLTTLEGSDTPGKVAALCSKAVRPDPSDPNVPSVAAVCVYENLVPTCVQRLDGTGVHVAAVATGFPSGQYPTDLKVADARRAVELGADEVDMVIDRGAFLSGRYAKVYDEIVQVKEAVGRAHLKVILETGELGTYDNVRRASLLAMAAGADFIKTSTGKIPSAATLPVALCMLEAIRDVHEE